MARTKSELTSWQWRLANSNGNARADSIASLKEWSAVSAFPSVVQMELVAKNIIPDANISENERKIQWAGETDWEYQGTFKSPVAESSTVDLVFEGLDTFATVSLNGKELFKSDNMFLPKRVSVKDGLRPAGESNDLHILFESALKVGSQLEKKYGARKALMRDNRRNHIRKAQYHWGWDWGPILVTAGPYMPIYLDAYAARVDDVYVTVSKLADDHKSATVTAQVSVVSTGSEKVTAVTRLLGPSGNEVARTSLAIEGGGSSSVGTATFDVADPQLWWPNGQGPQNLYTVEVDLPGQDTSITRVGIRTIQVVQRPLKDAPGTTFMFRVNGRDIFAQGGNWIPADCLLPTISRQRYFDWVRNAKNCHMNMIRVWGGGIYETDDFLDACDELGLLVWHDYGFACTNLPTHDAFIESVAKEAEAQTIRLRNRASLAILCGGNEDFMLFDWEKVNYDHGDTKGPFDDKPFPQRKIYLDILPKIAARLCPNVFYWANSPWSLGSEANDLTMGDVHQWSIWHGEQKPYQEYKQLAGRFVSEFGMHGFPVQRTIDYFARGASDAQRHPQSRLIDCHNKGHGAHTRIARYLAENFRYDMTSLENFAYSSQLMQSEAYGYALRDWKRIFGGAGQERCAGAIIWQLNDDYPCTSWSLVDYFIRPKPSWYNVRRAFAPISVAAERTPSTLWVDEDRPLVTKIPSFAVFGHNTTPTSASYVLGLKAYDFYTGQWTEMDSAVSKQSVTLRPGQNTELGTLAPQTAWTEDSLIILEITLSDAMTGKQVSRFVDWPEPYRYLSWPKNTSVSIAVATGTKRTAAAAGEWEDQVAVLSNQPLKGVWLEPVYDGSEKDDDLEPLWEDNMFDLMPGETMTVGVSGLKGRKVSARFLADWEVGTAKEKRSSQ